MDPTQFVDVRTMAAHQEFQIRDTARINAREMAKSMEPNSLQAAVVMEVSVDGRVMLDDFSNYAGEGQWMGVISPVMPKPGDIAVYATVKGSPVVIGVVPDQYSPYLINSPGFIYNIDHFHTPGTLTSGGIGQYGLGYTAVGGVLSQVNGSGLGSPLQGNGWLGITTPAVSANYGMLLNSSATNTIGLYTLNMFEMGVMLAATGSQFTRIGMTDAFVTTGNNGLTITYDTLVGSNWMVQGYNAGVDVFGQVDTGIAAVAGKLLCFRFTTAANGSWDVHYRCPIDDEEPTFIGTFDGLPNANVNIGCVVYNRAALARSLYVDYMAWAIEGMSGVF